MFPKQKTKVVSALNPVRDLRIPQEQLPVPVKTNQEVVVCHHDLESVVGDIFPTPEEPRYDSLVRFVIGTNVYDVPFWLVEKLDTIDKVQKLLRKLAPGQKIRLRSNRFRDAVDELGGLVFAYGRDGSVRPVRAVVREVARVPGCKPEGNPIDWHEIVRKGCLVSVTMYIVPRG